MLNEHDTSKPDALIGYSLMTPVEVSMSMGEIVYLTNQNRREFRIFGVPLLILDKPPKKNETATAQMVYNRKMVDRGVIVDWTEDGSTAIVENVNKLRAAFHCSEISKTLD